MDDIKLLLSILIAGFSILLFIVSTAAYYRIRANKLLLASFAFLAFLIKGILIILETIDQGEIALGIDLLIIILLYFSIIKK